MKESPPSLYVALTVDVDPDANTARSGRRDAVSAGAGDGVSLKACTAGLRALGTVLGELHVPCTFFWEARSLQVLSQESRHVLERLTGRASFEHGCHGLRHADFAGVQSGLPIGEGETLNVLQTATNIVAQATGVRPTGFRAPYCRLTPHLRSALARLGYVYDASLTRSAGEDWGLRPYRLPASGGAEGLWELALCRGRDSAGQPISGYLWQLFEGRRSREDYVQFAAHTAREHPGGLLQIALHPWHLIVDERGKALSREEERNAPYDLLHVLSTVRESVGVRFIAAGQYLQDTLLAAR